jgi:hypothetical protein
MASPVITVIRCPSSAAATRVRVQRDGCGQLEDGSGEVLVTLGDGDRP